MEKIYYQTLKETLFHEKLENGLEVYWLPKVVRPIYFQRQQMKMIVLNFY